ncbi:hypothetical protein QCA50_005866 [Cerrena zonata]|uniref:HNH nuclease domain-containing protein n=1 Tax=Cerrena zonata TaxID=2478898 RepID=A0AAW0GGD0_9APHY
MASGSAMHNRVASVDSSTGIECLESTESSLSAYSDKDYQAQVSDLIDGDQPTDELIQVASQFIDTFSTTEENNFTHHKTNICLDRVMTAMMFHAEGAGGERSQRYVAAAIVAAGSDTTDRVRNLAITWLTHFLYVFKAGGSHRRHLNKTPSRDATPTAFDIDTLSLEGAGNRRGSFRDDVLRRDGYECVVTGVKDCGHPLAKEVPTIELPVAHILHHAISDFDKNDKSAFITYSILYHFSNLDSAAIDSLQTIIDDTSNGITLDHHPHIGFDRYRWCLHPTERVNEYRIRIYDDLRHGLFARQMNLPGNTGAPVIFRDRSADLLELGGASRKRDRTHDLPNPHFIAIHAAIAGILHMSGAGKFFDELLDKYGGDDDSAPLLRWEEFELYMGVRSAFTPLVSVQS